MLFVSLRCPSALVRFPLQYVQMKLDSDSADGQIEGYDFWQLGDDLKVSFHTLDPQGWFPSTVALSFKPEGYDSRCFLRGDHVVLFRFCCAHKR